MILCIAGIALCQIFNIDANLHLVFWLESLALASFGFSWITKAEVVFQDENKKEPASKKVLQVVA